MVFLHRSMKAAVRINNNKSNLMYSALLGYTALTAGYLYGYTKFTRGHGGEVVEEGICLPFFGGVNLFSRFNIGFFRVLFAY